MSIAENINLGRHKIVSKIGATSVVEQIPLLTRDRKILKSNIVPLAK